jgi:hypothetical protein
MTMNSRTRTTAFTLAAVLLLAALPACVVVEEKRATPRPQQSAAKSTATPGTNSAPLPSGPVARPAGDALVSSSRVLVNVAPLGVIRYDTQCLPITSPDGRFIAVQEGDPPAWPTLLAEPGASPALATRIAVYNITSESPTPSVSRIDWPAPPPEGLVLGRSADDSAVLVELPRDDGSRWIGRLLFLSGQVQWLVQSPHVNAHAILTADDRLAFTRRESPDSPAALVIRNPDGSEITRRAPANASYAFPLATTDPNIIYALVRSADTTDIEALRLLADLPSSPARFGGTLARRKLAGNAEPALAYQIAATVAPPIIPRGPDSPVSQAPTARPDPLVLFLPAFARMGVFDARESAFGLLAPNSLAVVRTPDLANDGYFCATPDEIVFTPWPLPRATTRRPPDIRVLAGPFIPRATTNPTQPFILFAPNRADPAQLQLMSMQLAAPEP